MSTSTMSPVETLASTAGLTLQSATPGQDFTGHPTTRFTLALATDAARSHTVELSDAFDAAEPRFAAELATYLAEAARRLRDPRPDVFLSLLGLPLSFQNFAWPFHASTSGADTFVVHGELQLETGENPLRAKVSAALTQTFAEVVPALEQPFAEGFIVNAIRKTVDQGQVELTKSGGNRQPVPVTTRYYSAKRKLYIFNDTTAEQRSDFLAAKVYWLSGVLGGGAPVWIADPRDAQYLNTTVEELQATAAKLAAEGLIAVSADDATATPELMSRHAQYEVEVEDALNFIKPHFNEDMRAGNTNM